MNEIMRELESCYKIVSSITVSGDNVELVAAAKLSLRKAYNMAKEGEDGAQNSEDELLQQHHEARSE